MVGCHYVVYCRLRRHESRDWPRKIFRRFVLYLWYVLFYNFVTSNPSDGTYLYRNRLYVMCGLCVLTCVHYFFSFPLTTHMPTSLQPGVIMVALPISVISRTFEEEFEKHVQSEKIADIKRIRYKVPMSLSDFSLECWSS